MNTNTNTTATKTSPNMRKFWRTLSALDLAVIAQLTCGDGHLDVIANPCAWGALEDLAFGLDGQEVEDEGRAE